MKVDMHVHTCYSKDATLSLETIIDTCQRRGLDGVAITDHNTIAGALALKEIAPFLVIVGEEIDTTKGEILGLFLKEEIPGGLTPQEAMAHIREQGGLVGVSHPLDRLRRSAMRQVALLDILDELDFRGQFASSQEKMILHVGRIVHEKGLHLLVQAAPKILTQHKAKFVVVGMGDLLDGLRRQAQELGVGRNFHFTGFIPDEDRDRLYKVADCAVFPSLYEPFGIVALEAMAARVPVVVSKVGGLKEVVKHGETGITVYPNNPDSLAWGILHTLEHPEWAEMRVENAYRMVKEEYGWDQIARRTIEIYQRVVEERDASDW